MADEPKTHTVWLDCKKTHVPAGLVCGNCRYERFQKSPPSFMPNGCLLFRVSLFSSGMESLKHPECIDAINQSDGKAVVNGDKDLSFAAGRIVRRIYDQAGLFDNREWKVRDGDDNGD